MTKKQYTQRELKNLVVIKSSKAVYYDSDCEDDGVEFDEMKVSLYEIQNAINESDSDDKNVENWKFCGIEIHPDNKKYSHYEFIESNEFTETEDCLIYENIIELDSENNNDIIFVFRNKNDRENATVEKKTEFLK